MASYSAKHFIGDNDWGPGRRYDIKLDDLNCSNDDWNSCSYNTDHDCTHDDDIYLDCGFIKSKLCQCGFYFLLDYICWRRCIWHVWPADAEAMPAGMTCRHFWRQISHIAFIWRCQSLKTLQLKNFVAADRGEGRTWRWAWNLRPAFILMLWCFEHAFILGQNEFIGLHDIKDHIIPQTLILWFLSVTKT